MGSSDVLHEVVQSEIAEMVVEIGEEMVIPLKGVPGNDLNLEE